MWQRDIFTTLMLTSVSPFCQRPLGWGNRRWFRTAGRRRYSPCCLSRSAIQSSSRFATHPKTKGRGRDGAQENTQQVRRCLLFRAIGIFYREKNLGLNFKLQVRNKLSLVWMTLSSTLSKDVLFRLTKVSRWRRKTTDRKWRNSPST